MNKILLLTLALCLLNTSLFAHALWIETAATGQVGKVQMVRIFYGEYASGERDSVNKWYSDVKDFTLWLVGPDQKKVQLKLTPGSNHYQANFTPASNGVYTLAVSHYAKELGGNTRYHFLATADVIIGKVAPSKVVIVNSLQLQKPDGASSQVNKPLQITGHLNGDNAIDKKVSIFSPNGWTKELITDVKGQVTFTPPFSGRYVIEISDMDKNAGNHYGKPYQETWNGATYSFELK